MIRRKRKASLGLGRAPPDPFRRRRRLAARLRGGALAILLVVVCLRLLLTESLSPSWTMPLLDPETPGGGPTASTSLAFAGWILLAGVLWLIGQWLMPRPLVGRWALALIGLLAAGGLLSTAAASNKAAARNHSVQLLGYLLTFWLLLQLLRTQRVRQAALLAVLTAGTLFALQGLYQHHLENPQFLEQQWPQEREEFFARQGWAPDSPQARQYEERVLSAEVKGFAVNANMAAAILILVTLAGSGWAVQKWRAPPAPLRRVFAALAILPPGVALWALWRTGSRGGILAGLFALLLLAALSLGRRWFARHWRPITATVGVAVVAGIAGVTVLAARMTQPAPDSLSYRSGAAQSLLVRWHYWTGAWRVLKDHPALGAGAGNFRNAYLRHKRPEALEDVADAHNFAVTGFVEYGPVGGVALTGLVLWLLLRFARPQAGQRGPPQAGLTDRRTERRKESPAELPAERTLPLLGFAIGLPILLAILRALVQWPNYGQVVSNVAIAMVGPVIVLILALWRDRVDWPDGPGEEWTGLAIGCGAAGFVLAAMVDFGMYQSGPATAFWALGAIGLAGKLAREKKGPDTFFQPGAIRRLAWGGAALLVGLLAILFVQSVYLPAERAERAMQQVAAGRQPTPLRTSVSVLWSYRARFERAALAADPLEPEAPYFMADALLKRLSAERRAFDEAGVRQAERLYDQARRRDPADYRPWLRSGQVQLELASSRADQQQALGRIERAVELNPTSVSVRRQCGDALMKSNRPDEAARQYAQAIELDGIKRRYDPKGLFALGPSGRKDLEEAYLNAVSAARSQAATQPHSGRAPTSTANDHP